MNVGSSAKRMAVTTAVTVLESSSGLFKALVTRLCVVRGEDGVSFEFRRQGRMRDKS